MVKRYMRAPTRLVVDRAIRHARRLSQTAGHRWPTARSALVRILNDLEARDPADPSLDRLRAFIAEGDLAHGSPEPPDESGGGRGA
jgi:hypothetical protein